MKKKRVNNQVTTMKYPSYVDKEMCELLDALSKAMVPESKRKPFYRENLHTPYYSRNRYRKVA